MKRKILLITGIGIFILLYVVPLGVRPMMIPDEFRYAEIPREMLKTGDWIVPHLDGLRYFEKPVLGYWLNAVAIALFGENAFAIRLPSAVAVGLTALLLFMFVRKFSEDDLTAFLATTIFLLSLEVLAIGTFCVLDSVFSLFVTSTIVFFFWAFGENRTCKKNILLALAGLSCGLAFLTKGFLALVIPMIVIIPFMFWQGRIKTFLRTIWIPLVVMLLVVFPWSIMIHFKEPDFWRYFFWVEHVDRFISPNGGQHASPFWFYIPVIIGGAMPWTFLISPIIQGLRSIGWKAPMFRLALCWLGLPFLFFSASSGKLGTYILPCFPPLAILTSKGLLNYFKGDKRKAFTIGVYIIAVIVAVLVILLLLHQTMPADSRLYGQQETRKIVLAEIAFLTWLLFLHCAGRAVDFRRKLVFFAVGPAVFMFCVHFIIPEQLMQKKTPGEFLRRHQDKISQNTLLVSDNYLAPAVCWNYKRNDVYLLEKAGEFAYGLGYDDSKHRLLDIDHLNELITKNPGTGYVTLITFTKRYIEYEHLLPKPAFKDIYHGFIFVQFDDCFGRVTTRRYLDLYVEGQLSTPRHATHRSIFDLLGLRRQCKKTISRTDVFDTGSDMNTSPHKDRYKRQSAYQIRTTRINHEETQRGLGLRPLAATKKLCRMGNLLPMLTIIQTFMLFPSCRSGSERQRPRQSRSLS